MSGVEVSSYSGVKTGLNGYAVLPNAQPYRVNWVTLDTRNLGGEIELDNATQQLVPRRGSVVLARFEGSKGRRVQFELYDANGQPIPFGAVLLDSDGKQLALSDPTGKALALVTKDHGVITIKWQGKSCPVPYKLPEKVEGLNYEQYRLACSSSAK
jgi:outer membrane usher protein